VRLRLLLLLSIVLVSCVPPPVYRVQRSARVPRVATPLRSGAPLAGPVELSIGAVAGPKASLADESVALEVPEQQTRSELRIRIRRGEIAPFYEQAVESSYEALDPTQAPVREGAASILGLATRYSFATPDPRFSIGTALEVMQISMPYVEYRTCVEYCDENGTSGTTVINGNESTGSFGFGLTPTYRSGSVAFFGGVYARRHPTIERKGMEIGGESDQDITGGNYNFMLHAGVEVRASVLSFSASIQQDVTRDPVQYGPSVGFALAVHIPDVQLPKTNPPPEPAPPANEWIVSSHPSDEELPDDPW
jgi:hypothetical protein